MTADGASRPPGAGARDAAMQRLREWRTAVAVGGAGAVVLFAALAATTHPGQQASAAGQTSRASGSTGFQGVDGVARQDQTGVVAGGFGAPGRAPQFGGGPAQAVTGGS